MDVLIVHTHAAGVLYNMSCTVTQTGFSEYICGVRKLDITLFLVCLAQ